MSAMAMIHAQGAGGEAPELQCIEALGVPQREQEPRTRQACIDRQTLPRHAREAAKSPEHERLEAERIGVVKQQADHAAEQQAEHEARDDQRGIAQHVAGGHQHERDGGRRAGDRSARQSEIREQCKFGVGGQRGRHGDQHHRHAQRGAAVDAENERAGQRIAEVGLQLQSADREGDAGQYRGAGGRQPQFHDDEARRCRGRAGGLIRPDARKRDRHGAVGARDHQQHQYQTQQGQVVGVEGRSIPPRSMLLRRFHGGITWINAKLNTYLPPLASLLNLPVIVITKVRSRPYRARARKGVILAAGGFIFNKKRVNECNRAYLKCLPLGTYADDGTGIALGESVGGVTSHMDKMSAWRFYVPPEALMQGVLVDKQGQRICSED